MHMTSMSEWPGSQGVAPNVWIVCPIAGVEAGGCAHSKKNHATDPNICTILSHLNILSPPTALMYCNNNNHYSDYHYHYHYHYYYCLLYTSDAADE